MSLRPGHPIPGSCTKRAAARSPAIAALVRAKRARQAEATSEPPRLAAPLASLEALGLWPLPVALSARQALERVQELRRVNAQWPDIGQSLNPNEDAKTRDLLLELRGPYLFAPHVALNVLQIGCERALAISGAATLQQALRDALRADERLADRER